jgi:hypothetical protein
VKLTSAHASPRPRESPIGRILPGSRLPLQAGCVHARRGDARPSGGKDPWTRESELPAAPGRIETALARLPQLVLDATERRYGSSALSPIPFGT